MGNMGRASHSPGVGALQDIRWVSPTILVQGTLERQWRGLGAPGSGLQPLTGPPAQRLCHVAEDSGRTPCDPGPVTAFLMLLPSVPDNRFPVLKDFPWESGRDPSPGKPLWFSRLSAPPTFCPESSGTLNCHKQAFPDT